MSDNNKENKPLYYYDALDGLKILLPKGVKISLDRSMVDDLHVTEAADPERYVMTIPRYNVVRDLVPAINDAIQKEIKRMKREIIHKVMEAIL